MAMDLSKKIRKLKKGIYSKKEVKDLLEKVKKLIRSNNLELEQVQEFAKTAKLNHVEISKLKRIWNNNNADELWE